MLTLRIVTLRLELGLSLARPDADNNHVTARRSFSKFELRLPSHLSSPRHSLPHAPYQTFYAVLARAGRRLLWFLAAR